MFNSTFKEKFDFIINTFEQYITQKEEVVARQECTRKICEELQVDNRTFNHIFRFITNMMPLEYWRARRLGAIYDYKHAHNSTFGEAAEMFGYLDSNKFSKDFHKMYGESPTQVNFDVEETIFTTPLTLDAVFKAGCIVVKADSLVVDKSEWATVGNAWDAYGLSYEQMTFAKEFVRNVNAFELDTVCIYLAKYFPEKADSELNAMEKDMFYFMLVHDCNKEMARKTVAALKDMEINNIYNVDREYLRLLVWNLDLIDTLYVPGEYEVKLLEYQAFEGFKKEAAKKGYDNYWDYAMILDYAENTKTWKEIIKDYSIDHPLPIKGNWDESIIAEARGYETNHIKLAEILTFISASEEKIDFYDMTSFDEIVFRLCLHTGLSKGEAEKVIQDNCVEEYKDSMLDYSEFMAYYNFYKQKCKERM